ncbi:MAG: LysM peptidoglycan-binding domain-containing protein [Lachnospiraceae bacterium]|nr:LysM peptidoglycan-binding domain-containing protein [Lachnospiraceae bacterium]
MELPKNIVQIGRPDKVHKIFVEDYVVSYIKQLNKACDGRAIGLALYGRHCEEEGCHYYFLYGASQIQGLEQRGPYLSQADKEEIDETGKKYFDEYEFLAWCSIKGEPLESLFVLVQGKGIEINGYACFYEKNESMLNYMLLLGEGGKRNTPEKRSETEEVQNMEQKERVKPARGEWRAADYMRIPETSEEQKSRAEQKSAASKKSEHMKIAVAAVFLVLCVIGITTLNDYGKLEDLQVAARQVIASMTEQKIPDVKPDESPSPTPETTAQNTPPPYWPPVQPEQTNQDNSGMAQPSGQGNQDTEAQTGQDNAGGGTQTGQNDAGTGTETQPENQDAAQTGQEEQEAQSNAVENQGTAERPQPTAYTVVKGDTLIDICMRQYGSLENIEEICHLNGITNADNIQVGQTILLP